MSAPSNSGAESGRAGEALAIEFCDGSATPQQHATITQTRARELGRDLLGGMHKRRTGGAAGELERLHVEELSRLLSQAAELRSRGAACESPACEPAVREHSWLTGAALELAAWRSALADEVAAAELDGANYSPRLAAVLRACAGPPTTWPSARDLALAAAALHPSARAQFVVAAIALNEGDWAAARSALESALAAGPSPRLRERLQRTLRDLDVTAPRRLAVIAH